MKKTYLAIALVAVSLVGGAFAVQAQNASLFSTESGVVKSVEASKVIVEVLNNCKATSSTTVCATWYSKDVEVDFVNTLVTDQNDQVIADIGSIKTGDKAIVYYKSGIVYAMEVSSKKSGTGNATSTGAKMCTMDAMKCPDGKYVGRSGPNCEFVCGKNGNGNSEKIVRHLKFGMSAEDVKILQQKLQEMGYLSSDTQLTGYFGVLTLKAVKDFQRAKGVPPTGFVGELTLKAISN